MRGHVQIDADIVAGSFWRTLIRRFASSATTVLNHTNMLNQRIEISQTVELLEDQIECSMQIGHLTVRDLLKKNEKSNFIFKNTIKTQITIFEKNLSENKKKNKKP